MPRLCITPDLRGAVGGPSSFVQILCDGLSNHGWEYTFDLGAPGIDCILVINSSRELQALWRAKRRGVRIVQRLGGLNWTHRRRFEGLWHSARAEYRNLSMALVRARFADAVIYQSSFAQAWWERCWGTKAPSTVIYNGTNLQLFNPDGPNLGHGKDMRVLSVEGTQGADFGHIAESLVRNLRSKAIDASLIVAGKAPPFMMKHWRKQKFIDYRGVITKADLPSVYRSASIFISTDCIAACPNSVIEALSCGIPVLGFRTGVLPELVSGLAGELVEYGGNPWQGVPPKNIAGLADAAMSILQRHDESRKAARGIAEMKFDAVDMVTEYLKTLTP